MKAKFKLEDVFNITGRGVVLSGRITEGVIDKDDLIIMGDKLIPIRGLEVFRKLMDNVGPGDNVGVLVSNITKEEASVFRREELVVTNKSHIRQDKLEELGI